MKVKPKTVSAASSPAGLTREQRLELLALLDEKTFRWARRKLLGMFPETGKYNRFLYPKHMQFFEAGAAYRERCFMAGNRIGKTEGGAYETTCHLTGRYPEWWTGRRFEKPVRFWAAGKTNETTRDIVQAKLLGEITYASGRKGVTGTGMIPGEDIGTITWKQGVPDMVDTVKIKHVSGGWSKLGFKSYQQGRGSFEGTEQDGVWLDEEPPIEIYGECLIRTATTGGIIYITFTPLEGMSETVMAFLPNGLPDAKDAVSSKVSDSKYLVMAGWDDVPHLEEKTKRELLEATPPYLREARSKGYPVLGSGRIFPVDEETIKVASFVLPDSWPRICALDFGWDHPSAMIWLAWDRDNDIVYVYDCLRVRETTPEQQAPLILSRGDWIPVAWPHDGLNTEKGSGEQLAELYRKAGVNMLWERAQYAETGTEDGSKVSRSSVEAGLMDMLTRMQTGKWKVFAHLNDWFQEFRLYHRKDGKIVKLKDDLMSASRYGTMTLRFAATPPVPTRIDSRRREYDWRAG